jgi:hypothetical protein
MNIKDNEFGKYVCYKPVCTLLSLLNFIYLPAFCYHQPFSLPSHITGALISVCINISNGINISNININSSSQKKMKGAEGEKRKMRRQKKKKG